jgi:hypothetical protein
MPLSEAARSLLLRLVGHKEPTCTVRWRHTGPQRAFFQHIQGHGQQEICCCSSDHLLRVVGSFQINHDLLNFTKDCATLHARMTTNSSYLQYVQ